ncbi:MAG: hypothetical protein KKG92_02240, partial [Gammaproteobacteria bacterium]|nr:hypothetical protein [Gammaproteobacteria bacterium]
SPPHSPAMGQEAGEKWTVAVDLQPTIPKSDRLLGTASWPAVTPGCLARIVSCQVVSERFRRFWPEVAQLVRPGFHHPGALRQTPAIQCGDATSPGKT